MDALAGGSAEDDRIRDAITLAKNMRNNGVPLETIENRLANRGFSGPDIKFITQHVPLELPKNVILDPGFQNRSNVALVAFGMIICGLGALLVIGNRTGAAPTLPYMGMVVMIVGGAVMALGRS